MSIKNNLKQIQQAMEAACLKVNRSTGSLHLLAVSKHQPIEKITEAYELGVRDFGENYIQELTEKKEKLSHLTDIRWHMIGHLQSNKAKLVTKQCVFFHALDSEKILKELAKSSQNLKVFIEVNLDDEESKSGVSLVEAQKLAGLVLDHPSLKLQGLMSIPKPQESPELMRPAFKKLFSLAKQIEQASHLNPNSLELSMGMSEDFEIAIEEGSSWIRVGRKLFGERLIESKG